MFTTFPSFERWIPESLRTDEERYWDVVILASALPWYLLCHRVRTEEGYEVVQTLAVARESTLQAVLDQVGVDAVVSAHVASLSDKSGGWTMHRITEIWRATSEEEVQTGPLLFKLDGAPGLWTSHRDPAVEVSSSRRLLARFV